MKKVALMSTSFNEATRRVTCAIVDRLGHTAKGRSTNVTAKTIDWRRVGGGEFENDEVSVNVLQRLRLKFFELNLHLDDTMISERARTIFDDDDNPLIAGGDHTTSLVAGGAVISPLVAGGDHTTPLVAAGAAYLSNMKSLFPNDEEKPSTRSKQAHFVDLTFKFLNPL